VRTMVSGAWRVLQLVAARCPDWSRDASGNIALIFAVCLIPIVGSVALAIDFGRGELIKSQLQSAADAAAIAAARQPNLTEAEVVAIALANFRANTDGINADDINFAASRNDDGISIEASAVNVTTFGRIFGIEKIDVNVKSGAMAGAADMELALVLDNTGSMRGFMNDLRLAATELVETVHGGPGKQSNHVKIAVIPYVGAVNIGNDQGHMAWMDVNADADFHGYRYEGQWIGFDNSRDRADPDCNDPAPSSGPPDPGPGPGGGGGDRSDLEGTWLNRFAQIIQGVTGLRPAYAATPVPPGYSLGGFGNCYLITPLKVNQFNLFAGISNAPWKGCVEARAEPYDTDDTAPDPANPNTLFVPYFWPDESDVGPYPNSFRSDGVGPAGFDTSGEWAGSFNIWKYDGTPAAGVDEVGPVTKGPNQACPDPILPLTNDVNTVKATIAGLSEWEGSGTVTSEGLAWGWRTLSPTEPFTEGVAYGAAQKIIVLMTDGKNWAAEQPSDPTRSDYTAYNYLKWGRINPNTYEAYKNLLNERTLAICNNAKAAGVTIYTVTFGALDAETQALYESCATEPPMHFDAQTVEDLNDAFKNIAAKIMSLRLTK
jgi:Flp pilus assembly protein TadG